MRFRHQGAGICATGLLALLLQTSPAIGAQKLVTIGFLNNLRHTHFEAIATLSNVFDRIEQQAWLQRPIGLDDDNRERQLDAIANAHELEAEQRNVPVNQIPMPIPYTEMNTAFERVMYDLIDALEAVDYDAVPFRPEAQRIAEGFNLRLLNEDAREETVAAIDELIEMNDNIYIAGSYDIRVPPEFFGEQLDQREADPEDQPFIQVLDSLVSELDEIWIVPPDWLMIVTYLWTAAPNGEFRGQALWRINTDGPELLADGLERLYIAIYRYRAEFEVKMRRAFKFLPRELPVITDAYRQGVAIVEFFRFYEQLIDEFFLAVRSVVPPDDLQLELPQ